MKRNIPGPDVETLPPKKSFWQEHSHPFFLYNESDLPRLKRNAELPFWKPKFEAWRRELKALDRLTITTQLIDFHIGSNKAAHKAAMCYAVDGDAHYGRLVGTFLSEVVERYRRGPDWWVLMTTNCPGMWTGNQWGGLSVNYMYEAMLWISFGHLYDVIYGKGLMSEEDAATFEEMMAQLYQLSCLHEEMHKLDNNRVVFLCNGAYLSAMFDRNRPRADAVMKRLRNYMYRFIDTILEDGLQYEIGLYGAGTVATIQLFARCIRGAEGIDFFREKVDGVGLEEAYHTWVKTLIPGSSLRMFCSRDRVTHWESIAGGYREYDIPELGWAISRMDERPWVPMFHHWSQGFEFYNYVEPVNIRKPTFRHSHLTAAGIAFLRSSWDADASSLYFRYGFQGSSHGGGTDKLNIELTCNDEPLIADPMLAESSHDKNVVLVDGQCQEQCSGKLLYSDLREETPIQYVSALSGFGKWPNRSFLNDPRVGVNYWCTKSEECFPGQARMRRTVVQVEKQVYILRDTLWSLDEKEHAYEWLFHTFADPGVGALQRRALLAIQPKRLYYSEKTPVIYRKADIHLLPSNGVTFTAEKSSLVLKWSPFGAALPAEVALSRSASRYAYDGSPETGEGFCEKMVNRLHLELRGRDVVLTTVMVPLATGSKQEIDVEKVREISLNEVEIVLSINGKRHEIACDENMGQWSSRQIDP